MTQKARSHFTCTPFHGHPFKNVTMLAFMEAEAKRLGCQRSFNVMDTSQIFHAVIKMVMANVSVSVNMLMSVLAET